MSQENGELVPRLVAAFNARDPDAASAVLREDAEWRPAFTGGGAVEGAVFGGSAVFFFFAPGPLPAGGTRRYLGLREVEPGPLLVAQRRDSNVAEAVAPTPRPKFRFSRGAVSWRLRERLDGWFRISGRRC
jgi:hypothetical protein